MRSRARAAVLAMVATLVTAGTEPARAGDGKRALSLLPHDTSLVVSIDVRRVKGSWAFTPLQRLARSSGDIARVLALLENSAKISLSGNVQTAVVALDQDFDRNERVTVALEAAIDRTKLAALVKDKPKAVRRLTHARVTYYRIDDAVEVVAMRGHLLLTNKGQAPALIDIARTPSRRLTANSRMMALIKTTDTGKHLWAVFALPPRLRAAMSSAAPVASRITSVSASVEVKAGLRASVRQSTSGVAAATALAAALRQGKKDLAKRASIGRLGVGKVFKTMSVARNGSSVDLVIRASLGEVQLLGTVLGNI